MGFVPRQRDIFPLPSFDANILDRSIVLSRGTRRRIIKCNHKNNWKNDAITSLNTLGGHEMSALDDLRCLPSGTLAALEEVSQAFNALGSPVEPLLTPDGALRELLRVKKDVDRERDLCCEQKRNKSERNKSGKGMAWRHDGTKAVPQGEG